MTQKLTIQLILPVRKDDQSAEKARAAKAYYEKRGFEVVDPHDIAAAVTEENGAANEAKTQASCLYNLADADLAVLLPGWKNSEGCHNEIIFATANGIPIYIHKSNIRVFFNKSQVVEIESQRAGDILTPDQLDINKTDQSATKTGDQFAREVTEKIEERKVCEQIDRGKL